MSKEDIYSKRQVQFWLCQRPKLHRFDVGPFSSFEGVLRVDDIDRSSYTISQSILQTSTTNPWRQFRLSLNNNINSGRQVQFDNFKMPKTTPRRIRSSVDPTCTCDGIRGSDGIGCPCYAKSQLEVGVWTADDVTASGLCDSISLVNRMRCCMQRSTGTWYMDDSRISSIGGCLTCQFRSTNAVWS